MSEQVYESGLDDLEAPVWPKVVGSTSVVWAVLNTGCVGCGIAGLLMASLTSSTMQQAFPDGMPPTYSHPPAGTYISMGFGLLMSLLLLCAGIVLLLRRPAARVLHLLYGAGGLFSAAIGLYFQMAFQSEIDQWVAQNPDTAFAKQAVAGRALQYAIMAVTMFLAFAWPLFCLVWFGLIKRDSQEIARGVESLV